MRATGVLGARRRRDPALVEPGARLRRVLLRDTSMRGQKLREGDSALLLYASANRDEEVFADPFAFRVDRTRTNTSRSGSARTSASERTSRGWRSRR